MLATRPWTPGFRGDDGRESDRDWDQGPIDAGACADQKLPEFPRGIHLHGVVRHPFAGAVVLQGPAHRGEGQIRPRDRCPVEQADLRAFRPRLDRRRQEARDIDELDLGEPGDVVDGEQALDLDAGAGLFPGLALGALEAGLVQLHIAGRQGPEAVARVDGAPAEQDLALPAADRADHDLGILIGDEAAVAADEAQLPIPLRNPALEGMGCPGRLPGRASPLRLPAFFMGPRSWRQSEPAAPG